MPEVDIGATRSDKPRKFWVRPAILLGIIAAVSALSWAFNLASKLGELRDFIAGLGPLGVAVYVGVYIIGAVVALPAEVLTVLGASIFGTFETIIAISIASPIGAAISFLLARHFARKQVAAWLAPKERLSRLDQFTEKDGALMVAIARLAHILPSSMLSYMLGLTRVRFRTYLIVSWLCMLPTTILYVVGTDAFIKIFSDGEIPWLLGSIVVGVGLTMLAFMGLALRRLWSYRHEMRQAVPDKPAHEESKRVVPVPLEYDPELPQ